jgi:hypothetical protein
MATWPENPHDHVTGYRTKQLRSSNKLPTLSRDFGERGGGKTNNGHRRNWKYPWEFPKLCLYQYTWITPDTPICFSRLASCGVPAITRYICLLTAINPDQLARLDVCFPLARHNGPVMYLSCIIRRVWRHNVCQAPLCLSPLIVIALNTCNTTLLTCPNAYPSREMAFMHCSYAPASYWKARAVRDWTPLIITTRLISSCTVEAKKTI